MCIVRSVEKNSLVSEFLVIGGRLGVVVGLARNAANDLSRPNGIKKARPLDLALKCCSRKV
jgi:ribosomal protein S25